MRLLLRLLLVFSMSGLIFAQTSGQIPINGNFGNTTSTSSLLGGLQITLPNATSYTLTPAQWGNKSLTFNGTESAPFTVIAPVTNGQEFHLQNSTSQQMTFGGSTGATVTVAAGATADVWADGTNYHPPPAAGTPVTFPSGVLAGNGSSTPPIIATSHLLSLPANCIATSGSHTAYVCITSPTFTPVPGDHIQFEADVANTGSASLSVDGATAATIHKQGGSANLIANDLLGGHWVSMTFDGTYWQVEGQLGNAPVTSSGTTGQIQTSNGNGGLTPVSGTAQAATLRADSFTGADFSVQVNACITAVIAAGGGTCDARSLATGTASQQINVGVTGTNNGVTLLLPERGHWSWGLTTSTACGIKMFSGASLVSQQPGGGGGMMILDGLAAANMDSLLCTDSSVTNNYIRISGLVIQNNGLGTFAALADIQNLADESSVERVAAINTVGDTWHITNAGCGTKFDNIQGYASDGGISGNTTYNTGGIPLTITESSNCTGSLMVSNSTFNAPKAGYSNIVINGAPNVVTFLNIYMEGNGLADTTTPMVTIPTSATGVLFVGGGAQPKCSSACSKYIFQNASSQPWGVDGFYMGVGRFVNDTANGITVAGQTGTQQPPYWGGAYSIFLQQLVTKSEIISSLASTSTQCMQAASNGLVSGSGAPCPAAIAGLRQGNGTGPDTSGNSHNLSIVADCAASGGTATAYVCSTSPSFIPSSGDRIQFKANVTNTGSATLAVNGAAAATIEKQGGSAQLVANDLLVGQWLSMTFDGTYWQVDGQLGNVSAGPPGTPGTNGTNGTNGVVNPRGTWTSSPSPAYAAGDSVTYTPSGGFATAYVSSTSGNATTPGSSGTWLAYADGLGAASAAKSTAITGLRYGNSASADTAATTAQIQTAAGYPFIWANDLVYGGDSLTAASQPNSWTLQFQAFGNITGHGNNFYNYAVAGQTCEADLANYSTNEHTYAPDTTGVPGIYFLLVGTNNVGTDSAATAFSCVQSLWTDAHNDGYKVLAMTLPYHVNSSSNDAIFDAYNTLIRSAGPGSGVSGGTWDYLFDLSNVLVDPYDPSYFTSDQTHFTQAGATIVANGVNAALFTTAYIAQQNNAYRMLGTGNSNVRLNRHSMYATGQTGSANTAAGDNALWQVTGSSSNNAGYGYSAGNSLTAGSSNSFFGYSTGYHLTGGNNNVFVGESADSSGTNGSVSNTTIVGGGASAGGNSTCSAFGFGSTCTKGNQIIFGRPSGNGDTTTVPNHFEVLPYTLTYSATPTINLINNSSQTITLTGNVTSSTLSTITQGSLLFMQICENATGGFTWVWPTTIHGGGAIGTTASTCSQQLFYAYSSSDMVAVGPIITGIAP